LPGAVLHFGLRITRLRMAVLHFGLRATRLRMAVLHFGLRTTRLRVAIRDLLNGRGGIRTHGTLLTYTHFPGVRLKPLGHPSHSLRTADNPAPRGLRRNTRRTGRDSNSRYRVHRYAGFRDRCLQPLGHLSSSRSSYSRMMPSSTRGIPMINGLEFSRGRPSAGP
jgi:hypothetical protein